jgi:hypothetical protein
MSDVRHDALSAHGEECGECGAQASAVAALLACSTAPVDAARLSRLVLARSHTELEARARAVFWQRLIVVLIVALIPLPLVVAADLWALGWVYALASAWLPAIVATYLVISYGATVIVLLGSVYAAIPLLLAWPVRASEPVTA